MIDKSHDEQVIRWARFCKNHPEEFRKHLNPFLNSQIVMARKFYKRLLKKPNGKEIVIKLRSVR